MSKTPFRLKKVCSNCPFRADVPFEGLPAETAEQIADRLRDGDAFYCHKDVDYGGNEDPDETEGDGAIVPTSQFCAGALSTMDRGDGPNNIVRIAERLGLRDPNVPDAQAQPVYNGLDEWQDALTERCNTHKASSV